MLHAYKKGDKKASLSLFVPLAWTNIMVCIVIFYYF